MLATEEPLGIRADGSALTVTMRMPGDDVELAARFTDLGPDWHGAAGQLLDAIGMEASAGRARRELLAAGGTARRHAVTARVDLTAHVTSSAAPYLAARPTSRPVLRRNCR